MRNVKQSATLMAIAIFTMAILLVGAKMIGAHPSYFQIGLTVMFIFASFVSVITYLLVTVKFMEKLQQDEKEPRCPGCVCHDPPENCSC